MSAESPGHTETTESADPIVRYVANIIQRGQELDKELTSLPDLGGRERPASGEFPWSASTWYSQVVEVVSAYTPLRLDEARAAWEGSSEPTGVLGYGIVHFMNGISATNDRGEPAFDHRLAVRSRIAQLNAIAMGAIAGYASPLRQLRNKALTDTYVDELREARRLLDGNSPRAAGCLAGVALERWMREQCESLSLKVGPNATMSQMNDLLAGANRYGKAEWRRIQSLADIRNACAHPRQAEPEHRDVARLIAEAREITSSAVTP